MKPNELVAKIFELLVNPRIPKCSCDLKVNKDSFEYLHPTKGWRRVSFMRFPKQVRVVLQAAYA